MSKTKGSNESKQILASSGEFFSEVVDEALESRKIKTYPMVSKYIVDLLENYLFTDNLYDTHDESGRKQRSTLAEMLLTASSSTQNEKIKLLKKLGDSSLYISGFFAPSLRRKPIDVGYYVNMGCTAYNSLSLTIKETTFSKVYSEISNRFVEFVDVLTYIRDKSLVSPNQDLLELMEIYNQTGSSLAREELIKNGVMTVSNDKVVGKKQ